jgi:hypothetical protein
MARPEQQQQRLELERTATKIVAAVAATGVEENGAHGKATAAVATINGAIQ